MKKLFDMKDELNARLTVLAREKGMTKTGMLNLVVEKGIAYYEKKRFMNPTQEPYYYQEQPQSNPTATQPQIDRKQAPMQPQEQSQNDKDIDDITSSIGSEAKKQDEDDPLEILASL